MICSYCKTETVNTETCDFCKADLEKPRPDINQTIDVTHPYTQPELLKMHTIDLLYILRRIRADRADMYKTMQIIRKAPQEAQNGLDGYSELREEGIKLYRDATARKNVIEQILIDRMGYFPQRIDDKLLNALTLKINNMKNPPKG